MNFKLPNLLGLNSKSHINIDRNISKENSNNDYLDYATSSFGFQDMYLNLDAEKIMNSVEEHNRLPC